jgi:hypothetical protein
MNKYINGKKYDTDISMIIEGFRGCREYYSMSVFVTEDIAYDVPNPFDDEIGNAALGVREDVNCLSFLAENRTALVFIPLDKIASIELNLFEK